MSYFQMVPGLRHGERILEHLDFLRDKPSGKPPPEVFETDDIAHQTFDDGWGGYDESSVTYGRIFLFALSNKERFLHDIHITLIWHNLPGTVPVRYVLFQFDKNWIAEICSKCQIKTITHQYYRFKIFLTDSINPATPLQM